MARYSRIYAVYAEIDARGKRVPDRIDRRASVDQPVRDDYVSRQAYRLACRLAKKGRVR